MAPADVLREVAARPEVRRARAKHELTYGRVYYKSRAKHRWQVSFFAPPKGHGRSKEISQTVVDDRSGRVLESWTGYKVEWTMARGYAGAFGRIANALWVWLPLCLLFVLPFARPPWRLLHLDLLVLLAFSVSYAFFQASRIDVSVPLVYPLLAYLLVRMLMLARGRDRPKPVRLTLPINALGIAAVFILGFRCGLNVVGSNVIDVGYASVIGADHFGSGRPVYGHFPLDNQRGDTYGPVLYYAYVPFEQLLPWRGGWDDLPAAHAAAVAFDLADRRRAVAAGAAAARAGARDAARLRVGDLPVHAAGRQLEHQRRPGRGAGDGGDARAGAARWPAGRSWPPRR